LVKKGIASQEAIFLCPILIFIKINSEKIIIIY
jgi:hypothetical protein